MPGKKGWQCSDCGFNGNHAPYLVREGRDLCIACVLDEETIERYAAMMTTAIPFEDPAP